MQIVPENSLTHKSYEPKRIGPPYCTAKKLCIEYPPSGQQIPNHGTKKT